jgi:hypothetical protein
MLKPASLSDSLRQMLKFDEPSLPPRADHVREGVTTVRDADGSLDLRRGQTPSAIYRGNR